MKEEKWETTLIAVMIMAGIVIIVILISLCIIATPPRATSHHLSVRVTDAAAIQVLTAMNQND